jgi:hypothetical protein
VWLPQSAVTFVRPLVAQHHSPSYLPAGLQVAQRHARLLCRPGLDWNRLDLASLNQSKKLPQILERPDVSAPRMHAVLAAKPALKPQNRAGLVSLMGLVQMESFT